MRAQLARTTNRVLWHERSAWFILLAGAAILGVFSFFRCQAAETNAIALPEFQAAKAREYLRDLSQLFENQLPVTSETLYTRARLYSHLGEKEKAEALGRQALKLDPNRADICLFLAEMLIREDRMEGAAEVLQQAVKANPAASGGKRQLGMVLDRLGKHEEAEAAFNGALKQDPRDAATHLLLGRLLLDHGRLTEAVTHLEQACQLDPKSANAYYPLFQAQTKLGNKEAAQQALAKFNELKKVEKSGMGTLTEENCSEETLRFYAAAFHTEIGSVLRQQGNAALAEAHLLQAIRIAPQHVPAYEVLSDFYLQGGRLEEARSKLEKLVQLRPSQVGTRVNFGTTLLQLKDYPAAIEQLKRAIDLDPKQPQALYNLARHYLSRRSELPHALELAERLVACKPSGLSYDLLGWALYANGRTNDALRAMSQAVEKAPEDAGFRQRYERLKKTAGAKP